jgi:hypothetical protein
MLRTFSTVPAALQEAFAANRVWQADCLQLTNTPP